VHIVERQPRIRERLLPSRFLLAGLPVRLDPFDRRGQARLGAAELQPSGIALIAPQSFLQCLFYVALQRRADRRAHRIRIGRNRLNARDHFASRAT
jgi:hypothetical protein